MLVQSGNFKNWIDYDEIVSISSIVKFDFMGSSEFENGALYKSLRRMVLNRV